MIDILKKVPLFEKLGDYELQILLQRFQKQYVDAHTILFREHDPGDTFIVILKGSVKIYTKSNNGDEKILTVFKSGDSFGELSLIDQRNRSATAQTLEETHLFLLKHSDFMNLLSTNFTISHAIMVELCNRIRNMNQQVSDLYFLDARTRVIKNLIQLANHYGNRSGNLITINIPLNYEELSQMASVQTSELTDVLNDLIERNILSTYANYYAINVSNLRS